MKTCTITLIGALILAAHPVWAFEDADCRKIVPTTISVRDDMRPGEAFAIVRDRALERASQQAVADVVGVTLRSQRSMEAKVVNDQVDERFQQRAMSQSKGLVRYKVTSERTEDSGDVRTVVVTVDAKVCLPKSPDLLKEVVFLGPTLSSRGDQLVEFRDALAQVFSKSPSFILAGNDPDGFHDVVITGRINEVEIRALANGPGTNLSGRPSVMGDGQAPTNFQRMRVNVTVEARRDDGTAVSHTADEFRNVTAERDRLDAINLYVPGILKKVAEDLHSKLLATRPGAGPVSGGPAPAGVNPAKPTW